MRVHVLQHVPFEGPARIRDWADRAGHALTVTRFFQEERAPKVDDFDMLVVMGGPMGANDDHTLKWMRGEKQFIAHAIEKQKKVLGVCLGAQMIASVLGAKVVSNPKREIGFYPIELDCQNSRQTVLNVLPQKMNVFHWHGDTFELPAGALHLARSQACKNQAFSWNRHVVGLQFHLEVTMAEIESLVRYCSKDLVAGDYVMTAEEMFDQAPLHVPPMNAALSRFLDGFAAGHV